MTHAARSHWSALGTVALAAVLVTTTAWSLAPTHGRLESGPVSAMHGLLQQVAAATADAVVATGTTTAARTATAAGTATSADPVPNARAIWSTRLQVEEPAPAAAPAPKKESAKSNTATSSAPSKPRYRGTNHFWFPALGMSYRVVSFPCPRQRPPDNYLYRWGCAGRNNVYLMGHAYSVMNALHDAYVAGRLRKGMVAIYADGNGRVRKYRITEWRVVDPAEGVWWAIADQPRPSMTLQTCVGSSSQWRLNVRLVAID